MELFKKGKPINISRVIFVAVLVLVPVINWLIFYVYCNGQAFLMAFTDKDWNLTFDHFIRAYHEILNADAELGLGFRNTFLMFAVSMVVFIPQVLVSYFIYKRIPFSTFDMYPEFWTHIYELG